MQNNYMLMASQNRPTFFYATVSVTIVLVLTSIFLTLFLHANHITDIVKQNLNILVEVQDVMPVAEIDRLKKVIMSKEGVIPASIEFVGKEKALEYMSKELTQLSEELENPFRNLIKFNLRADFYTDNYIKQIQNDLEFEKGVIGLYYENDSIDLIKSNINQVSYIILGLTAIFVFLTLAIIFNTIRLTLFADIKFIRTMQIVGAENKFIAGPYYTSAFKMSLVANTIILLVLGVLYYYGIFYNAIIGEILNPFLLLLTWGLCLVLALLITLGSTYWVIHKFLKDHY